MHLRRLDPLDAIQPVYGTPYGGGAYGLDEGELTLAEEEFDIDAFLDSFDEGGKSRGKGGRRGGRRGSGGGQPWDKAYEEGYYTVYSPFDRSGSNNLASASTRGKKLSETLSYTKENLIAVCRHCCFPCALHARPLHF